MINSIPNTKEIDKIIRNELITQSELDGKFVRNALSEYGTDLDKNRLDSVFESIESTDCCILFETQSGNNYDVSLSEEDDAVTYYKSFKIKIITLLALPSPFTKLFKYILLFIIFSFYWCSLFFILVF